MDTGLAYSVLHRMDHQRALSLLGRVQPDWVAECAAQYQWFCQQILQLPADRGTEVFEALCWKSSPVAAGMLAKMEPDDALRFLDVVDRHRLDKVLESVSREVVDRLLDRMTPECATAALVTHTQWSAYMLMVDMDRQRAEMIISRIGPGGLGAVLDAAGAQYVARLVAKMDQDEATSWLQRMEAFYAAEVLGSIDPAHLAGVIQDLDLSQAAWWLDRMKAAHAAKVLDVTEPQCTVAIIGHLEEALGGRHLNDMSAAAVARVLTAMAEQIGLARAAEIASLMDPGAAGAALEAMEPYKCVPLLKSARPQLADALLARLARSRSGPKLAQIVQAVCERPGDLAAVLTRNPPATAAQIVEALPAAETAVAVSLMDVPHAQQLLRALPRAETRYPNKLNLDRYRGKQIDILKAIEQFDEALADRLTHLLGLATGTRADWFFTQP
jgi:Mg/Co/Ni transporter MgtE